jgi:NAD(P)-dependent dehydrogenase (short-subunit alcohol dehydrogenase family)
VQRTVVVTGSAGGIGSAIRRRLAKDGVRVIGVDVHDADVRADLSNAQGRNAMIEAVRKECDGVLDGVVAGAGIMGTSPDVVSINYFGAIATLDGLRPFLAHGTHPAAVAISSNSSTTTPGMAHAYVETMLDGDEIRARTASERYQEHPGMTYATTKLALARWVRRKAVQPDWIGKGIRLNAIAPGVIETPMTKDDMEFIFSIPKIFPIPIGRAGKADEIAATIAFLLSPDAGFFCGSVLFEDGGTDAAVRPNDYPTSRP